MLQRITKKELWQAQIALFVAIGLQFIAWRASDELLPGSHYLLILTEVVLAVVIGLTANLQNVRHRGLHHAVALGLLAMISFANITALVFVLHSLIVSHAAIAGSQLLVAAIVIILTNIIVYGLWYWEIDSPGLTRTRWSKHDKDFQFTQQDLAGEFPNWRPEFIDYLFLSIINAFNGATTGAKPLTHQAKLLMASQALISIFTLALVLARSVSILGT